LNVTDAAGLQIGGTAIGTWQTYTPTLTATTTNPTLGTGSVADGYYTVIDKVMIVQFYIKFGSSGAAAGSGEYRISTPSGFPTGSSQYNMGWAWLYDQNVATAYGAIFDRVNTSDDEVRMYIYGNPIGVTDSNPFTWTTNDQIRGTIVARLA
jgi:hypothetical protein